MKITKVIFLLGILSTVTSQLVFASSYLNYFQLYDIQVQESSSIDTQFPRQPTLSVDEHGSAPDLSTLISVKLTKPEDHYADAYVYFPKVEILAPIVLPDQEDQEKIFFGRPFDHFPYLEQGALHYFGDSPQHGSSNMVLAAHSSYRHDDSGRYKTIFQVLPLLRAGDEIHYYEKTTGNTYDFHRYQVSESYETTPDDISILQDTGVSKLTAYTCRPIGTTTNRRVVASDLVESHEAYHTVDLSNTSKSLSLLNKKPSHSSVGLIDTDSPSPDTDQTHAMEDMHGSASSISAGDTIPHENESGASIEHVEESKQTNVEVDQLDSTSSPSGSGESSQDTTISDQDHETSRESHIVDQLMDVHIASSTHESYRTLLSQLQTQITVAAIKDPTIVQHLRNALRSRVSQQVKLFLTGSQPTASDIRRLILIIVVYQSLEESSF